MGGGGAIHERGVEAAAGGRRNGRRAASKAHLPLESLRLDNGAGAGARQRAVPDGERVRDRLRALAQRVHRLLALHAPRVDRRRLLGGRLAQPLHLDEKRPPLGVAACVGAGEALVVVGEHAAQKLAPHEREQRLVAPEHRSDALPCVAHDRTPEEIGRAERLGRGERLPQPQLDVHGGRGEPVALARVRRRPVRQDRDARALELRARLDRLVRAGVRGHPDATEAKGRTRLLGPSRGRRERTTRDAYTPWRQLRRNSSHRRPSGERRPRLRLVGSLPEG